MRITVVLVLMITVLAGVAACMVWWLSRSENTPLRIGLNAWPGYEFLYLAQERGFYREAGVRVQLVEFNSLSDARRAYERGQIDGLGTTVIEVLQARQLPKRNLQVVDVVDYSDGADEVLVRPGRKDLRGARIGVELGSLGIYVLVRALEQNRLTLADITALNMDQLSMQEAYQRGDIDALVTYPPVSVAIKKDGKAHAFFTTASIPGEVIDVIAVDEQVATERADEVRRLLSAFHRAMEFAVREPSIAMPIMAAREGISPEEFSAALHDGVKLVGNQEQALYLGRGGRLAGVIDTSDRIMRASGQITGSDRRDGSWTDRFVVPSAP